MEHRSRVSLPQAVSGAASVVTTACANDRRGCACGSPRHVSVIDSRSALMKLSMRALALHEQRDEEAGPVHSLIPHLRLRGTGLPAGTAAGNSSAMIRISLLI